MRSSRQPGPFGSDAMDFAASQSGKCVPHAALSAAMPSRPYFVCARRISSRLAAHSANGAARAFATHGVNYSSLSKKNPMQNGSVRARRATGSSRKRFAKCARRAGTKRSSKQS